LRPCIDLSYIELDEPGTIVSGTDVSGTNVSGTSVV
jgi:hypothetical protein